MNITKINKYKKMNNTSTAEQKTDININQINKYKKTEQHFQVEAQDRTQLHFGEPNNKHTQIQQRNNKPQNFPQEKLMKILNQQLYTKVQILYTCNQKVRRT